MGVDGNRYAGSTGFASKASVAGSVCRDERGMMSDLDTLFAAAAEDVKQLPERPDNAELLQLYALYKQGSQGDVYGDRPGMMAFF
jgi:hypothetical protein